MQTFRSQTVPNELRRGCFHFVLLQKLTDRLRPAADSGLARETNGSFAPISALEASIASGRKQTSRRTVLEVVLAPTALSER